MDDVVIVGGGPAGALAATLLARQGFKVRVFDRAKFPRAKLCGDTLNPGACRVLAEHFSMDAILQRACLIDGMVLTGPGGVSVRGWYGPPADRVVGYAIERRVLDDWLLQHAAAAGALVDEECTVDDAVVADGRVTGVRARGRGGANVRHLARLVIAADGRHSRMAFNLGLARHPKRPRRWAIGAYFENVGDLCHAGEMHVRHGYYVGVAPMPGGLANACLVVPHDAGRAGWRDAASFLVNTIARDPRLAPRFAHARLIGPPAVLGPMAVDAGAAGAPGLLLAGDAAGFIDPMTGDGLNLALRGSAMASRVAAAILNGTLAGHVAAHTLAQERHAAFSAKWRFNRSLRRLVASPYAVSGAAIAARVFPRIFEQMIRYAGDVPRHR